MKTEIEKEEKHLDSIIAFNKREIRKMRKRRDVVRRMQHAQALEMAYMLKRSLIQ